MLIDAFTRSVQMFLSGERPEPSHRTANGHANLTKGLSKVCFALYIIITYICVVTEMNIPQALLLPSQVFMGSSVLVEHLPGKREVMGSNPT